MPTIHIIDPEGASHPLTVPEGTTIMQAAVGAGLAGIVGECGGSAMCATCHVLVDEAWIKRLPAMLANEHELLDCTASPREAGSRLSCQIRIAPVLDGLVVRLPPTQ